MVDELVYDLMSPSALANPYPIYARMREEAPVAYIFDPEMKQHVWLLTRYDDCVSALKDPRFFKDIRKLNPERGVGMSVDEAALAINRHMLTVDPPDHTRLRGLVSKAFTPSRIENLQGRVQQMADDLLTAVEADGEMDLIERYAFPLPVTVIAELLGVPAEDRERFREWSQTIILNGMRGENLELVGVAALEFIMYFHDLFDQRRAEPKDDLISALLAAEEAGDKLDQQELISMVFLLLVAGHETTVNLIGNGTLTLLRHPEQRQLLQDNPALIRTAIEEMLRYEAPVGTTTMRWSGEAVEMRGQLIQPGDMVIAALLAANRDPNEFPNPDTFDIRRTPNRHLAFGHGIHYCLGAPLARLEGAIAINTLLRRLPTLELASDPDALEWAESRLLHGLKALPVRW